jgi:hypothetical protein
MATLQDFKEKLGGLAIDQLLNQVIRDTEDILLNLVKSQLEVGLRGDGSPMPDYISITYADFKKNIVGSLAPFLTTDLKLEGDFYGGFYAQPDLFGITIGSTDWKEAKLEGKYGSEIFILTKENLAMYALETVLPELLILIRQHLGL